MEDYANMIETLYGLLFALGIGAALAVVIGIAWLLRRLG